MSRSSCALVLSAVRCASVAAADSAPLHQDLRIEN